MEWNTKRKRIAELEREVAELRETVTYWQAVAEHNAKAGEWWRGSLSATKPTYTNPCPRKDMK